MTRINEKGIYDGKGYLPLLRGRQASELIKRYINRDKPFLYSRWGDVEARAIFSSVTGVKSKRHMDVLFNNASVFPNNGNNLKDYGKIVESAAPEIDIYCVFPFVYGIDFLYQKYSCGADVVSSDSEYPFIEVNLLTKALKGKRVLIIYPFSELIEEQYGIRNKIWSNGALPDFEKLTTYKAVQSLAGNDNYSSWMEAICHMEGEIEKIDFDRALIGCGAYGMPLGAYIKKMGKKVIHIGGSLQILFGIKGRRWEGDPYRYDQKFYNEYWKRPYEYDKTQNWKSVEEGCYW